MFARESIVDRDERQAQFPREFADQEVMAAETAPVIAFLASPAASYITGAVIDSNGGYTA
jgi:NAD(P)-dependent dehydrogenase (short-subunit alcohol dehydrogenase family)